MDFCSSSELITGTPRRPASHRPKATLSTSDDTSSPGLSAPYDTVPDRRILHPTTDPSAAACRVRGLATSFATSTTGPADACAPEHPWASPFKVFPSTAVGAPLGAHTLLTLPAGPTPPRGETRHDVAAFRVSFPRRVRAAARTTEVVPAVDTFLGFDLPELALARPGARFDRGASPLALRRLDVQARPGLRVLRCERVERSVSGPPTLLGFSTFRRIAALRSSLIGAGLSLRLTRAIRNANRCDPCPSATTQQQIPGLLPGTGALRSSIGDLVRSSALVCQRTLRHACVPRGE